MPTFTSPTLPLAPLTMYVVEPVTVIVEVLRSLALSVMVEPDTAVTSPAACGRMTTIPSMVKLPSLSRVCLNAISSPTWRSDSAIDWPPFM